MRYEEHGYHGTPEEIARLKALLKEKDEPKQKKEPNPPSPLWEKSSDKLRGPSRQKRRFRKG